MGHRGGLGAFGRALIVGALFQAVAASGAAAAEQVGDAANASVPRATTDRSDWESGLKFDTSAHRAWYSVFWTGECGELPFFERLTCVKRPSWSEVTQMVLAKSAPDLRDTVRSRMIELGREIGHEWARHNEDRRISTDDLRRWAGWLKKSGDLNGTIDRVDAAVRKRLGKR